MVREKINYFTSHWKHFPYLSLSPKLMIVSPWNSTTTLRYSIRYEMLQNLRIVSPWKSTTKNATYNCCFYLQLQNNQSHQWKANHSFCVLQVTNYDFNNKLKP